jgi:hypothetical protein
MTPTGKKVHRFLRKFYDIFGPILIKFEVSRQIFVKTANSYFSKNSPVGATPIHADGQTDMIMPTGAIRDYANWPKV